ncbi:hypothetical protein [Streptomyces sp. bgisy126]|uniref:hypothetical protein n=1 Tax=unclassified Streptomyces TaxID=2593676 RepID=UPI003EBF13E6
MSDDRRNRRPGTTGGKAPNPCTGPRVTKVVRVVDVEDLAPTDERPAAACL